LGRFGLDPRRVAQVERPERRIHRVAGDVAQGTGAEVPPTAPLERRVRGVIGAGRGGAEPQVPIDPGGRVVLFERPLDRLRPDRPVGPELDLAHRPDGAGFDPLADLPRALAGVALVPHLGSDFGLAGRFEHVARDDGERDADAHVADELASRDAFPSHDATLPSRPPRAWARARPPGETGLRTRAAPPRQTRRAAPRTSAIVPASGWLRRRG